MKPLYLKGDQKLISNYRPISLLTSFSKTVEKVMFDRLINYLNKYAILSPNQYGFQKNLSTDNAVYALLNEVLTALNNKSRAKGIFCDIKKAFDGVNHDVLLYKLEIYGITGSTKELFSQFLTNRYQQVNLKDTQSGQTLPSKWSKIKHVYLKAQF
jgi:retron-type reverse transcriptase